MLNGFRLKAISLAAAGVAFMGLGGCGATGKSHDTGVGLRLSPNLHNVASLPENITKAIVKPSKQHDDFPEMTLLKERKAEPTTTAAITFPTNPTIGEKAKATTSLKPEPQYAQLTIHKYSDMALLARTYCELRGVTITDPVEAEWLAEQEVYKIVDNTQGAAKCTEAKSIWEDVTPEVDVAFDGR